MAKAGRGGRRQGAVRGQPRSSRCSIAASRPAESRGSRRSTASASAAPSSWRSPATGAIASNDPSTRVGLPEVKVGLFPGAGGTQRIARLMPPGDALQMLMKGEQIRPDKARAMRLVDEVAAKDEMIDKAKAWINGGGKAVEAVGRERLQAARRAGLVEERLHDLPARQRDLPARDAGQLPGDPRDAVRPCSMDCSCPWILRSPSRAGTSPRCCARPRRAAMIRTFFVSMQELNKGARRPNSQPKQ